MKRVAGALGFAHFAKIGARARADDDKPEDERAEDDEQDDSDRNDSNDNGSKGKKGRRADDCTDDPDAEDDDPDADDDPDNDDSGKGKKGKKAKGSHAGDEGDDEDAEDDDESEMRGSSTAAAARRREQARCAAIFASKAAGRNLQLAANLAFNTRMTRKEALTVLESTPAPAQSIAPDRAARNPRVGPGASSQPSSKQAVDSSWDRAFASVNRRSR
ncbi:hypothetical protein AB3X93_05985 [Paraburkholderia sp. BR14262]